MSDPIFVNNLATGERVIAYGDPRRAVIQAHAEAQGDFHTWLYEVKYTHLVTEGSLTVTCGDWTTFKEERFDRMLRYDVQVNLSRPSGEQGLETYWATVNSPGNHDDARILADRVSAINKCCTRIEVRDLSNGSQWVTAIYGEQYPIIAFSEWAKAGSVHRD